MIKKIVLLLVILLLSGCQEKVIYEKPEAVVFKLNQTLDVYSEVFLLDIIEETNATITSDNYQIDTSLLGSANYEISYTYNKKQYIYKYEINIVDNVAPFVFGGTSFTLVKNSTKDFCGSISFGDNYDSKAGCEIIGDYDFAKPGSYEPQMIVTDQSGNTTKKTIHLKIIEKSSGGSSNNNGTTSQLNFADLKARMNGEELQYGIDVSSWQNDVDYEKVKAAGISFVMIRIGFQNAEGVKEDRNFQQNLLNAKAAGLKVGLYIYTNAKTSEEIKYQHKWIINKLAGTPLDLPIAFDWENWSTFNNYNLSFYELNKLAIEFIELVNSSGYQGCLYSSKYYLETIWNEAKAYPVWLAHYTEKTSYNGEYFMWQLSSIGRVPGINGAVDLNILYQ